jgi:hypothetical protein
VGGGAGPFLYRTGVQEAGHRKTPPFGCFSVSGGRARYVVFLFKPGRLAETAAGAQAAVIRRVAASLDFILTAAILTTRSACRGSD